MQHLPIPRTQLPADRNPALVYVSGLAPGSRRTQADALDVIAGILTGGKVRAVGMPWHRLDYQHTHAVRTRLAERYAPETCKRMLAALRAVLRHAWRLGHMSAEAYQRAADIPPVKGTRVPAGRDLSSPEIAGLYRVCASDAGPVGARDAALLSLLYACGLRRAEAVGLDLADFDSTTGALRVRGKGNRERTAYLDNGALLAVRDWVLLRGDAPGPLLCRMRKGGTIVSARLTPQAVLYAVRRRASQAGVAHLSPHDFRRTFVGDLLDAGADLATVQALAGHADPRTTSRYDRRGEDAKRRAVASLRVPYRRRVIG